MHSRSRYHDHSLAITVSILEVFNLNESEKREALNEIYARVYAGLQHYEEHSERMHKRLYPIPSKN